MGASLDFFSSDFLLAAFFEDFLVLAELCSVSLVVAVLAAFFLCLLAKLGVASVMTSRNVKSVINVFFMWVLGPSFRISTLAIRWEEGRKEEVKSS